MASTASITDNFDDNSVNGTIWDAHSAADGTPPTVAETNSRLEITLINQAGENFAGLQTDDTALDMTGSYVFARLVQGPNPSHGGAIANILLGTTDGDAVIFAVAGGNIEAYTYDAGLDDFVVQESATYSATTHAWLRVHETAGNLIFSTAPSSAANPPDSGDWVTFHSVALPFAVTSLLVILRAGTDTSGASPGTVIWDGFNTGANAAGGSKLLLQLLLN